MTYGEALSYIHSFHRFASAPSLSRMKQLLALLGNPQDQLHFVHVAGTNGKGSTAIAISSILSAAGYKTALTISPFVFDFRERMQIDGNLIAPQALAEIVEELRGYAGQVEELTEFELVTAAAFLWFSQEQCDIAVAEVGLGGRFDATNVISAPLAAVVTKIGLDHTQILGSTTEQIAHEKCGIIKRGTGCVVTCPHQDPDALAVLLETCMQTGNALVQPTFHTENILHEGLDGTRFLYGEKQLRMALPGRHQIDNALTAITVCEQLAGLGYPRVLAGDAIARGLSSLRFPARLEVLRQTPPVVVDGAHNPDGAKALLDALRLIELAPRADGTVPTGGRPLTGVIGMLGDKDSAGALAFLAPRFAHLYCVAPDNPRALPAEVLAKRALPYCCDVKSCSCVPDACKQALKTAAQEDGAVVVCGSLYLAAQARTALLDLL